MSSKVSAFCIIIFLLFFTLYSAAAASQDLVYMLSLASVKILMDGGLGFFYFSNDLCFEHFRVMKRRGMKWMVAAKGIQKKKIA